MTTNGRKMSRTPLMFLTPTEKKVLREIDNTSRAGYRTSWEEMDGRRSLTRKALDGLVAKGFIASRKYKYVTGSDDYHTEGLRIYALERALVCRDQDDCEQQLARNLARAHSVLKVDWPKTKAYLKRKWSGDKEYWLMSEVSAILKEQEKISANFNVGGIHYLFSRTYHSPTIRHPGSYDVDLEIDGYRKGLTLENVWLRLFSSKLIAERLDKRLYLETEQVNCCAGQRVLSCTFIDDILHGDIRAAIATAAVDLVDNLPGIVRREKRSENNSKRIELELERKEREATKRMYTL